MKSLFTILLPLLFACTSVHAENTLPVEICNNGIDDDGDGFTDDDDTDCQWSCDTQALIRNKINATSNILVSVFQIYNDASGAVAPADTLTYSSVANAELSGQRAFVAGLAIHPYDHVHYATVVDNLSTPSLENEYHYDWTGQRSQLVRLYKGAGGVVSPVVEGVWVNASWQSLGFAPDGRLWAIDFATFQLVNIDLETGLPGTSWDILNLGNVIVPNDVAFLDNGQALIIYNDYTYYIVDVDTGVGYTMNQGSVDLSGFGPESMPFLLEGFCFTSNWAARGTLDAATEDRMNFYEVSITDQLGRINNPFTAMPLDTYADNAYPGYFNTGPGDMASCIFPSFYFDYGDVPPTMESNITAARHGYNAHLRLGQLWDISIATNPASETALGDDEDGLDDEDGVTTLPIIDPCSGNYSFPVNVTNNTGVDANLIAWMDWDHDNVFEPNESSVLVNVPSVSGLQQQTINFSGIQGSATDADVYIRIRLSSDSRLDASYAYGTLNDGEVEDYKVLMEAAVFAPQVTVPDAYCLGNTIAAPPVNGQNLLWYDSPTGGLPYASFPVISTAIPGSYTVYVSQTIEGCTGPRAAIPIVVYDCRPVINDQFYEIGEDEQLFVINPMFGLAEGDTDINNNINPNGYSVVAINGEGSLVVNPDGTFNYSPPNNYSGVFYFVYQGCDLTSPEPLCAQGEVAINIVPVNDAPVALNDSLAVDMNGVLNGTVAINDLDVDSENLVFSLLSSPTTENIEFFPDGSFVYVPDGIFLGEKALEYEVCDDEGLCASAWLIIDVQDQFVDTDGDGFVDVVEDQNGSDPLNPCDPEPLALLSNDCDDDGITNQVEFEIATDPINPDTDGDGINDGDEYTGGSDPLDACDPNPMALSTNDCDMDGLSNEEEAEIATDPANPDSDGDGINDGDEVDGFTDPLDACDPNPMALSTNDCDEDGLTNAQEAAVGTNPTDPDSDNDGYNDGNEVANLTNPLNPCDPDPMALPINDCDEDGLTNDTEIAEGTDPTNPDTDGDGLLDGEEVIGWDNPITEAIAEGFSNPLDPCDPNPNAVPSANCPVPVIEVYVPPGLSFNGDGVGDELIIENIEFFPNNTLTIFNRWGSELYKKNAYTNDEPWRGEVWHSGIAPGDRVTEGTYFYVLDKGDGSDVLNGFIVIKYQ